MRIYDGFVGRNPNPGDAHEFNRILVYWRRLERYCRLFGLLMNFSVRCIDRYVRSELALET